MEAVPDGACQQGVPARIAGAVGFGQRLVQSPRSMGVGEVVDAVDQHAQRASGCLDEQARVGDRADEEDGVDEGCVESFAAVGDARHDRERLLGIGIRDAFADRARHAEHGHALPVPSSAPARKGPPS